MKAAILDAGATLAVSVSVSLRPAKGEVCRGPRESPLSRNRALRREKAPERVARHPRLAQMTAAREAGTDTRGPPEMPLQFHGPSRHKRAKEQRHSRRD